MVPARGADISIVRRGAGPACLVLTGSGTKPYERQMPVRLGEQLELVFVELRGSGLSTGNAADLTFDVLADDLEAVRAHIGAERVAVLGHSILGVLAVEYARKRPASVSHVITAGTPPKGDMKWLMAEGAAFFERDASDERKALMKANLAKLGPAPSPREFVLAQTPMRFCDAGFDAAPLFAESSPNAALIGHVMTKLAPTWDILAEPQSIRAPMLVACGRHDYVVPHTLWDPIIGAIPSATKHLFERSGHQPFFEEGDRFVDVLVRWMGLPATPARER